MANKGKSSKNKQGKLTRREMLAASSMSLLAASGTAFGQGGGGGGGRGGAAPAADAAPKSTIPDTEWHTYGNDVRSNRYVPIDQIDGSNFNKLEMVWRFGTQNLGPRWDAD